MRWLVCTSDTAEGLAACRSSPVQGLQHLQLEGYARGQPRAQLSQPDHGRVADQLRDVLRYGGPRWWLVAPAAPVTLQHSLQMSGSSLLAYHTAAGCQSSSRIRRQTYYA